MCPSGQLRPHAVISTSNGGSFSYDLHGNMTSRRVKTGDPAYMQAWDYENRLKWSRWAARGRCTPTTATGRW